jgi:hypothetical protein
VLCFIVTTWPATHKLWEVIVADNHSSADLVAIAERFRPRLLNLEIVHGGVVRRMPGMLEPVFVAKQYSEGG